MAGASNKSMNHLFHRLLDHSDQRNLRQEEEFNDTMNNSLFMDVTVNSSQSMEADVQNNNNSSWLYPVPPLADTITLLCIYYCPFLVIFGTIGNVLSIMVFSRKAMNSSAMSVYSRFMAFCDVSAIYVGPLFSILILGNFDVQPNYAACSTLRYGLNALIDTSAYMVMSLTVERLLSVLFPHKVRFWCSKKMSYYMVVVVVVVAAVTNCPPLLWSETAVYIVEETGETYTTCITIIPLELEEFWLIFEMAKSTLIPSIFMTISNIVLLVKLFGCDPVCSLLHRRRDTIDPENNLAEIGHIPKTRKRNSVTLTLISVSVVYILCNLPIGLLNINVFLPETSPSWNETWASDGMEVEDFETVTVIFNLLIYTNNCLNFLMYCACGTRFRRELINMVCFWRRQPR